MRNRIPDSQRLVRGEGSGPTPYMLTQGVSGGRVGGAEERPVQLLACTPNYVG